MVNVENIKDDINLVHKDGQLHIMQDDRILISGFNNIGTTVNGLIPLYYKKDNLFKYYDIHKQIEYTIQDADWISGFHYLGSNLNTMFHNLRTNPVDNLKNNEYIFNTDNQEIINVFKNLQGYSSRYKIKQKYDQQSDSFIEFTSDQTEHVITRDLMEELMDSLKYLRIAGKGQLNRSHNFIKGSTKDHDGNVIYTPQDLTLKGSYGVIDVRDGSWLLEPKHSMINILPWTIECNN